MSSHCYCSNCGSVGVFLVEAGAMNVPYPEVSDGTENLPYRPLEDYPLTPLLGEPSIQATEQSWVTQPEAQSELQFDPRRVEQFFLASSTTMWPLHVAELNHPFPVPHQALNMSTALERVAPDPCPQRLEQGSHVDYPARFHEDSLVKPSNSPRKEPPADVNDDLLILTKAFSEVLEGDVIAEATEFANRSVEQRQWEAQIAGKVKRPANPWILYRKTYAGAIHGYDAGTASRILAKSWAIERDSVRQAFREISDTNKSLHLQAFPTYRFNPREHMKSRKMERRHKRRGP